MTTPKTETESPATAGQGIHTESTRDPLRREHPTHPMSLLTPSESRAFQSFLDASAFPMDWSMQLEISQEHMPPAHGTEALTKATKDLMSLDTDNWRHPLAPCPPGDGLGTLGHRQQPALANPFAPSYPTRQQRSLVSGGNEAEPASPPLHGQLAQFPFYHAIHPTPDPRRPRADPHSHDHSSSSSSSSEQSLADLPTSSPSTARPPSSIAKRSSPPDAKSPNKRYRPSTSQGVADDAQQLLQNRAALLSPSQKKANHIQSEQKRRANIRRGYDALCDTVPALREACQAEDEQQLADGRAKSRRKGRGRAKSDDGEKVDGRAGPRSENVVLSKTIDYLHDLLSEREVLMRRLHVARRALSVDHPLLHPQPDAPLPLWERKWTGGEAKGNDDDDDDDDD